MFLLFGLTTPGSSTLVNGTSMMANRHERKDRMFPPLRVCDINILAPAFTSSPHLKSAMLCVSGVTTQTASGVC